MRPAYVLAGALAMAVLLAPAASATFPGRNGKLAITVGGCGNGTQIRAYDPRGRALGRLSDCKRPRAEPDWSGDGRLLAYMEAAGDASSNLVVAAADGSERRVLPITRGTSDYTG